jgi:hypothetical protein
MSQKVDDAVTNLTTKVKNIKLEILAKVSHTLGDISSLKERVDSVEEKTANVEVSTLLLAGKIDATTSDVEFHGQDIDSITSDIGDLFTIVRFLDEIRIGRQRETVTAATANSSSSSETDDGEDEDDEGNEESSM